jgi:Na+-driven multidrug efflux pump
MGIFRAYTGGFRGAGKTLTVAAITIFAFGFVRLSVAWVASQGLLPVDWWFFGTRDARGIWLSFAVSNIVAATLGFAWYLRGTWRDADLTDEETDPTGDAEITDDDAEPTATADDAAPTDD